MYRSHGLLIHPAKTRLYQSRVDFLGLSISKEGIKPTEEGVEKVQMWPTPTKPKEVAAFVGFIQFYSQFMPTFSELSAPLNQVKNKKKLVWTAELEKSFLGLKKAFSQVSGRKHLKIDQKTKTSITY